MWALKGDAHGRLGSSLSLSLQPDGGSPHTCPSQMALHMDRWISLKRADQTFFVEIQPPGRSSHREGRTDLSSQQEAS